MLSGELLIGPQQPWCNVWKFKPNNYQQNTHLPCVSQQNTAHTLVFIPLDMKRWKKVTIQSFNLNFGSGWIIVRSLTLKRTTSANDKPWAKERVMCNGKKTSRSTNHLPAYSAICSWFSSRGAINLDVHTNISCLISSRGAIDLGVHTNISWLSSRGAVNLGMHINISCWLSSWGTHLTFLVRDIICAVTDLCTSRL